MYLVTVSKLISVLVKGRDKEIERCTQLVILAESMTEASKAQTQILEKLRDSIESDRRETERLHTYLQARDARGKRP